VESDVLAPLAQEWPDPGLVYIFTNAAMPGVVKIGLTRRDDVEQRLKELWTTGVPMPFECRYRARVPDCGKLEKVLHRVFDDKRLRKDREFFASDPALAELIIDLVKIEDQPMSDADQGISPAARAEIEHEKARKAPNLDFGMLGIEPGATLSFLKDPSVTCEVVSGNKVRFGGEVLSCSAAALKVIHSLGFGWSSINGWDHWTFEGVRLTDLRPEQTPAATGQSS
jgi:T5orf172 domain-containing protein